MASTDLKKFISQAKKILQSNNIDEKQIQRFKNKSRALLLKYKNFRKVILTDVVKSIVHYPESIAEIDWHKMDDVFAKTDAAIAILKAIVYSHSNHWMYLLPSLISLSDPVVPPALVEGE